MTPLALPDDLTADAAPLTDRVVLVTGAGQGLGRGLALAAARRGATVVLLDRAVAPLEAVYDEIEALGAPQPAIYPMDLLGAGPEDHAALATRLEESLGGLHALVHNAAVLGKPAPLTQYHIETWYKTLQVNLNAPFLLIRYCLPLLLAAEGSRMVFVSDQGGRAGAPFSGAYGVSKWGLEGLMHTLVAELPDDSPLHAVSVDPGAMHTPLRRAAFPAEDSERLPDPAAVAERVACLLDPGIDPVQGGCYQVPATREWAGRDG